MDEVLPQASRLKNTSGRGDIAEFAVLAALALKGKKVLRPVSSAMRYDLLVDNEDGTFTRIQCKSGIWRSGRVEFRLYSMSGHRGTKGRPYATEVDAYGVHCQATGATYLVPASELQGRTGKTYLRVEPARNGQKRRVRSADAFRI